MNGTQNSDKRMKISLEYKVYTQISAHTQI